MKKANTYLSKQLNSNDCELYYNLGLIYQLTNEMDMSNSMFEKTIEINPDYFKAYSNLGENYVKLKNKELALEYFNKYLKYVPDDSDTLRIIDDLAKQ